MSIFKPFYLKFSRLYSPLEGENIYIHQASPKNKLNKAKFIMATKEVFEKEAKTNLESDDESDLEVDEIDSLFDGLMASTE